MVGEHALVTAIHTNVIVFAAFVIFAATAVIATLALYTRQSYWLPIL